MVEIFNEMVNEAEFAAPQNNNVAPEIDFGWSED
jgi:hypothetical protein